MSPVLQILGIIIKRTTVRIWKRNPQKHNPTSVTSKTQTTTSIVTRISPSMKKCWKIASGPRPTKMPSCKIRRSSKIRLFSMWAVALGFYQFLQVNNCPIFSQSRSQARVRHRESKHLHPQPQYYKIEQPVGQNHNNQRSRIVNRPAGGKSGHNNLLMDGLFPPVRVHVRFGPVRTW